MQQAAVPGHGQVLDVHFFNGVPRYRTVVTLEPPAVRLLVVDLEQRSYAEAGELSAHMPGLPLATRGLLLEERLHLVGLLSADPPPTRLNVFLGRVPAATRKRTGRAFQVRNSAFVADLGVIEAGWAVSHVSWSDPTGLAVGRAVAEPMVELLPLAQSLFQLDWRVDSTSASLLALCETWSDSRA